MERSCSTDRLHSGWDPLSKYRRRRNCASALRDAQGVILWSVAAVRDRIQTVICLLIAERITALKTVRATVILLSVSLCAAGLHAAEGMWMPQQIPEMAARLKAL